MARLTDHDFRDAQHALRCEIAMLVGQYTRRMAELGKAHAQEAIEEAAKNGDPINGIAIGREAARRASLSYFSGLAGEVYATLDSSNTTPALEQTHP